MRKPRPMKLNRNHTHVSLYGHAVKFVKGEPVEVPSILFPELLAIGAEFADGEGLAAEPERADNEPHPDERADLVLKAVLALAERNDNDDFTASGQPKVEAVTSTAGFKVTGKEVAAAWQRRADMIAEGGIEG